MATCFQKTILSLSVAASTLGMSNVALAYSIKYNSEKTEARIFCDNGQLAGTFLWNGSAWSNGSNSGPDIDALARKQVALNGSDCH
jgi:hypothetical protein